MELNEYQQKAERTWGKVVIDGNDYLYPAIGLAAEAGEFLNKLKKIYRDDNRVLTPERREEMLYELGDMLWYIAVLSKSLNISLEEVAVMNNKKLESRLARGTVHGSGDKR